MSFEKCDFQNQMDDMGLTEEIFDEYIKTGDEIYDFTSSGYFIIKEGPESIGLNLKEFIKQLPLAEIRSGNIR